MTYQIDLVAQVVILGNKTIPIDMNNRDYLEYLEWVSRGNVAEIITNTPNYLIT